MKKKLLCLVLAVLLCLPFAAFAACGEEEVTPGPEPQPDPEPAVVTIVSFEEILSSPKTSYKPGEIFNISGLAVKVNLSNGKTKNIFDTEFTEWTHQGEELTEDVEAITVTVPGTDITFDVAITVSLPEGAGIELELGALYSANGKSNEWFLTTDVIDFTVITVNYIVGTTFTKLTAADWSLYEGEEKIADPAACTLGEGEHTLTVKYLTMSEDFTVLVKDADAVITPELIEAENCAYRISTGAAYTTTESTAFVEGFTEEGVAQATTKIRTGASGTGAVSSLSSTQNGPDVYFQFDVKVPEDGDYKILVKGQSTSVNGAVVSKYFAVNLNGATGADGELEYTQSTSDEVITGGNQMNKFIDSEHTYTAWYNMIFWSSASLGTYHMDAGVNTVRIIMPNGFGGNVDLFQVVKAEEEEETEGTLSMYSVREGAQVSLATNKVYLNAGETLTDAVTAIADHPAQYTYLYVCLNGTFGSTTYNNQFVPVTAAMLSEIDYTQLGDQEVTVHLVGTDGTDYGTAAFTLCIREEIVED